MGPTPNKGFEAAGLQRLALVLKQLSELVPMLDATSEPGQAVLKMIQLGAKHIPPGAVNPASERGNIEQLAMRNAQQSQQAQQMRMPPGGAPPPGGGALSPQPGMPA